MIGVMIGILDRTRNEGLATFLLYLYLLKDLEV